MSLSICLSLSPSLYVCLSVSLSLFFSLSLYLSISLSIYLSNQAAIRGWLTRCYVFWYAKARIRAAIIMQAYARGMNLRTTLRVRRLRNHSATAIMRIYRGYKSRGSAAAAMADKELAISVLKIQKVVRGIIGRQRGESKRTLDQCAKKAMVAGSNPSLSE